MAESPCPTRRQGPTGGRGRWGGGRDVPHRPPRTWSPSLAPFFPLAPGAQARPIWTRPPPPIFHAPFRSFPALSGPQYPGAIPCVAPGKRLEWAPTSGPQKPGARTEAGAAAYPVSRQGLGYRSPGPVRRALRQTPGLEALQSIEGRSQARPTALSGRPGFPSLPGANPGQRKNRGPGAKGLAERQKPGLPAPWPLFLTATPGGHPPKTGTAPNP